LKRVAAVAGAITLRLVASDFVGHRARPTPLSLLAVFSHGTPTLEPEEPGLPCARQLIQYLPRPYLWSTLRRLRMLALQRRVGHASPKARVTTGTTNAAPCARCGLPNSPSQPHSSMLRCQPANAEGQAALVTTSQCLAGGTVALQGRIMWLSLPTPRSNGTPIPG
jgi:hypothetical protein